MDKTRLEHEVQERLAALGLELVDLRIGGSTRRPHISVRIDWVEAASGRGVTADDCARASRALETWLDAAGVGGGRYILEVSSPGVDRPLKRLEDWKRFRGRRVDVLVPLLGGRFRATAVDVMEGPEPAVELEFERSGRRVVRLAEIKEARLGFDW